jgi:putative DNA primase/helicase
VEEFFLFTGQRWEEDVVGGVMRRARKTADRIYIETAKASGEDSQKKLAEWSRISHSRSRLDAMIDLAKSVKPIPVKPESLDSNPWLLNCKNGTLELRTLRLRPHSPGDLISSSAEVPV